jgi:hypothetical protein
LTERQQRINHQQTVINLVNDRSTYRFFELLPGAAAPENKCDRTCVRTAGINPLGVLDSVLLSFRQRVVALRGAFIVDAF